MITSGPFGHIELSQEALRVFEFAAQRSVCDAKDFSTLGLDDDTTERALKELLGMRLLSRTESRLDQFTAVPPRAAANRMLRPMERYIREQHEEVERFRWVFESLLPVYESGWAHRSDAEPVELITDLRVVQETIEELMLSCHEEVLAAQPGGPRSPRALEEAAERDYRLLARGVAMRTLYQHTARYHQPTVERVRRMTSLGAEVRTQSEGLCRMLIFDHRVALLGLPDDPQAALVVREPHLIHCMRAFFDCCWRGASPFPLTFDTASALRISGEIQESIAAMLSEGLEDKSIARRLGMSVRSCQRHVSEIMKAVGATSRFQAGYLLGQLRADRAVRGEE
ncbi:LuxR family transcriptional regulator [Streptomyces syringium]|uniref:LuxR family transcriptional regulator n=1 Tax=Streptomyces syringium TaxID=76729 RepID=UPI003455C16C